MKNLKRNHKHSLAIFLCISLMLITDTVFGATSSVHLGGAANNVVGSMSYLARFITALSYILGFAFSVGAIIKFKAHKDNPHQMSIGTPIALTFVALALIFLPMIFAVSGNTIFGTHAAAGGAHGFSSF